MSFDNIRNSNLTEYIGNVRIYGDEAFDSDTVSNCDSKQWRWLSYPLSRLVLNPKYTSNSNEYIHMQDDLDLVIGYYVGDQSVMPFFKKRHCTVMLKEAGKEFQKADTVSTVWYPYKIEYEAGYRCGSNIKGFDFFTEGNSIIRAFQMKNAAGKTLELRGMTDEGTCEICDNVIIFTEKDYYYAVIIGKKSDKNGFEQINDIIYIDGYGWKSEIQAEHYEETVYFGYGFSVREDGIDKAIARVKECFSKPVPEKLADTKSYWDILLGKVPMPAIWGIINENSLVLLPELHRRFYYGAWAFILSNSIAETPEKDFNYRQITCGKGSLYPFGNPKCPCNCAWESFFEIQMVVFVDPETAWSSIEGFMSLVDESGWLDGECLPSQKARTAWVVYSLSRDVNRLKSLYSPIKRYLLWREENPRWIWDTYSNTAEKDFAFVSQWYSDVGFAIKICREIGLEEDISYWENKRRQMEEKIRDWFISSNKIHAYYFTDSCSHSSDIRNGSEPEELYVAENLVNEYQSDTSECIKAYYLEIHNPKKELAGFRFMKYGNACNIVRGLFEKGLTNEGIELIDSLLLHSMKVYDFCEVQRPGEYDVQGVNPSAFSAIQIIDFTWLKNGMNYEKCLL